MTEGVKCLNVVIVGGGHGCKAIMDMISAEKLRGLRMKLIGVACTNSEAVGKFVTTKGHFVAIGKIPL
ncbi:MAG: hypothetical protein HWN68_12890 [Desulfobacterales bacterium]|nr:hypothetical protein [Desulfobacterales bacterium]